MILSQNFNFRGQGLLDGGDIPKISLRLEKKVFLKKTWEEKGGPFELFLRKRRRVVEPFWAGGAAFPWRWDLFIIGG